MISSTCKFDLDYIINHIKQTKFPLWSLYVVQNYRRIPIMHYCGDDFTDSETSESKSEKSVNRLLTVLSDFPTDAVLSIDLKNSKTANGSGILGPIEFVNIDKDEQNTTPAAFSGFGQIPAGFVSVETLNGKLEELKAANERQINELLFKQRERDFNDKVQRERTELKELRKELNDEKKKYESNTGQAAETLVFAIKKIIAELFPGAFTAQTQTAPALSGSDAATNEPEQYTAKEIEINKLCNLLNDNPQITENEVKKITFSISEHMKKNADSEPKKEV